MTMHRAAVGCWHSEMLRTTSVLFLVLSVLLTTAFAANAAHKPSYTVLHQFTGGDDGGYSVVGLVRDPQGNLYGTTEYGGAFGYGTVFRIDTAGKETVLHTFAGGEGMWPAASLLRDKPGNLYGTTMDGGTSEGGKCFHGCGTVFRINTNGQYSVLYAFTGGADGSNPESNVIMDAAGNLYGTTVSGGSYSNYCLGSGCGVVFKIDQHGNQMVLYSFTGTDDGGEPSGGLVLDTAGNLYGNTGNDGTGGWGTVYKMDSTAVLTVLHSFTDGTDGGLPSGSLVRDKAGNLYGSAVIGGDLSSCNFGTWKGCGVVFTVAPDGNESVLHTFTNGSDQRYPNGGLLLDGAGNLYGTTGHSGAGCGLDCGTVFKLMVDGKLHVLHSFGWSTGLDPSSIIRDVEGNIYGTTSQGGHSGCPPWNNGCGVVYKLTP